MECLDCYISFSSIQIPVVEMIQLVAEQRTANFEMLSPNNVGIDVEASPGILQTGLMLACGTLGPIVWPTCGLLYVVGISTSVFHIF